MRKGDHSLIPPLLNFIIIVGLILIFSKKELSIILGLAAILFGILAQVNLFTAIIKIFINPSILLLALSVTLLTILGGILEDSGLIMELIQKLKISKKLALIFSPALFGLLPVAGGALMSAPIVDQIDHNLNPNQKVAINVWYRHVLLLIYPISSAILVASMLSGIPLYTVVLALFFPFILTLLIGWLLIMRKIENSKYSTERDLKRVGYILIPILLAPLFDFTGRTLFRAVLPELFLVIGLFLSITITLKFANLPIKSTIKIWKQMKVWRFPLLILSVFLFLNVFIESGVPEQISEFELPFYLFILLGFFLGFATGRIQLPISILIPIYLFQYSLFIMPLLDFVLLYFSVHLGYLISPLHPCVAYNLNYFNTDIKKVYRVLLPPTLVSLGSIFLILLLKILF
jgi:integral membrane protein (TIGR00529 family)